VDDRQTPSPQNSKKKLKSLLPPPTGPKLTAGKKKISLKNTRARARAERNRNFSSVAAGQVAAMKREQNEGDSVLDWGGNLSSIYLLHKP